MVLPGDFTLYSYYRGTLALDIVHKVKPDIILLDIALPDMDGIEVLSGICEGAASPPVIMLTGYSDIKLVVQSVRAGAFDYIVKPFKLPELMTIMRKALSLKIGSVNEEEPVFDAALRNIVGECAAIRELRSRIAYCASFDGSVLLLGESGTGKDLVARLIHAVSPRKDGFFLAKNCAAIPETIFEAEIFGCEKGAFTDAVSRAGSFEQASGGTLFLDEISEIPLPMQPKLLRILEEKHVRRIGGNRSIPIDVRIITASNTDLREAVDNKTFRKDLYYRICIFIISLPPLRERKEDIPLLAEHFIAASGRKEKNISAAALEKLQEHEWPGNVRELQNVIFRAIACSPDKKIGASHISFY